MEQYLSMEEIDAYLDKLYEKNNQVHPKYKARRFDLSTVRGRLRHYCCEDNIGSPEYYFLSSTSILSSLLAKGVHFNRWLKTYGDKSDEIMQKKGWIGTITHIYCSMLIWGEEVDTSRGIYNEVFDKIVPVPDKVKRRLMAFVKFYEETQVIPIATEILLYNPHKQKGQVGEIFTYPFGGTADLVCWMPQGEGKPPRLTLCDFKTGNDYKHEHELQLTSYKILWDSLYAKKFGEIEDLCCLYLTERGNYKLKYYKFVPDEWFRIIDMMPYFFDKKVKLPKELPNKYVIQSLKEIKDERLSKKADIQNRN